MRINTYIYIYICVCAVYIYILFRKKQLPITGLSRPLKSPNPPCAMMWSPRCRSKQSQRPGESERCLTKQSLPPRLRHSALHGCSKPLGLRIFVAQCENTKECTSLVSCNAGSLGSSHQTEKALNIRFHPLEREGLYEEYPAGSGDGNIHKSAKRFDPQAMMFLTRDFEASQRDLFNQTYEQTCVLLMFIKLETI